MELLAPTEEEEELPGARDSRVGCSFPVLGGTIVFFKCASVVFEGSLNWGAADV